MMVLMLTCSLAWLARSWSDRTGQLSHVNTSVPLCFCSQTHSEAVRLDDYDELANHKGQESDMFQWLTHQALHGLTGAQVGSVVFKSNSLCDSRAYNC